MNRVKKSDSQVDRKLTHLFFHLTQDTEEGGFHPVAV